MLKSQLKGDKLRVNKLFLVSMEVTLFATRTIQEDNKAPDHLLTRQRLNE